MKEFIGWISAAMLAVCAVPQMAHTLYTGDTQSFTWSFLLLWTFGDFGLLYYTWHLRSWALRFNYGLNAVAVAVILLIKMGGTI